MAILWHRKWYVVIDGSITGFYRCAKVQHEGDSHGQEWTTKVEALPL